MSNENKKQQKNLFLTESTIKKIEQLKKDRKLTSHGAVIEYLVDSYFANESAQNKVLLAEIDEIIVQHVQRVFEPLNEDLKRIRVTGNVIDRNTQMMLEFWNHYFIMTDAKKLGSTDKFKTVPFEEAEELVKGRIAHNRQKKIDRETKRVLSDNQGS
ncbi:hypothetical protein [Lysinibacillus capsici]|uniref:hypothetical protein n=1 Tax=Lysinibacillus capsici TaxID=2115968 RepID=UPI0034E38F5D